MTALDQWIPRDIPLRRWRVRNFKSLVENELEFAALTVIAGNNSSGKSSLLQSILVLAQSARGSSDAGVALNGSLVQLGRFSDVRSLASSPGESVELEASFVLNSSDGREPDLTIRWTLGLGESSPRDPGQASIRLIDVQLTSDIGDLAITVENQEAISPEMLSSYEKGRALTGHAGSYNLHLRGERTTFDPDLPPVNVYGVHLEGTFPRRLLISTTSVEAFARAWFERTTATSRRVQREAGGGQDSEIESRIRSLETRLRTSLTRARREQLQRELTTLRTDVAQREAAAMSLEEKLDLLVDEASASFDRIVTGSDPVIPRGVSYRLASIASEPEVRERYPDFVTLLGSRLGDIERVLEPDEEPESDLADSAAIRGRQFLESGIHYLGPLRQGPGPNGNTGPTSGLIQGIGTAGEYTASVLRSQGESPVICPLPDGPVVEMPLLRAVNLWLQHLGVAEDLSTRDLDRGDVEVRVRPPGLDQDFDLSAVGVGVSQVLPVIVLCLMVPPRSLVLLEQPELHLHPALQQKLGDFLLSCSLTGRQILVETHSEHIVARLRRRAAEDEDGQVREAFALVFATYAEGRTSLTRVATTEMGTIVDWPEGFFDQGVAEARRILQAGVKKRQKQTDPPA